MDATETLVSKYLAHEGYSNVVYEPDGNIPPDFLINGRIAVEVRRLNQNHHDGVETRGIEEVSIPLWHKVSKLALSQGAPVDGESWFVFFRFTRPVADWKVLGPILTKEFHTFAMSANKKRRVIAHEQGIEIEVFRSNTLFPTMFVMAGCSDQESGGWLLSEMEANIRYCASEKSRKVGKVRAKYPSWWLALVDHIGYGLEDFDREMFREKVSIEHDWDKIIIIDPRDHTRAFEL
jgi:hypothetical protein